MRIAMVFRCPRIPARLDTLTACSVTGTKIAIKSSAARISASVKPRSPLCRRRKCDANSLIGDGPDLVAEVVGGRNQLQRALSALADDDPTNTRLVEETVRHKPDGHRPVRQTQSFVLILRERF